MTPSALVGKPRLTFVDAHHHLQDIENHYYPWLTDKNAAPKLEGDPEPIRRNYLPVDYLADVATGNVVKTRCHSSG